MGLLFGDMTSLEFIIELKRVPISHNVSPLVITYNNEEASDRNINNLNGLANFNILR